MAPVSGMHLTLCQVKGLVVISCLTEQSSSTEAMGWVPQK